MSKKVNFSKGQKSLIIQWSIASVIIFVIYLIQTLNDRFGDNTAEVWEWLMQYILPPLTLMIGVMISQVSGSTDEKQVDQFYLRLASGISYFFLLLLFFSPILVPILHQNLAADVLVTEITEESKVPIIEAFQSYNTFMLPVQGFTTLSLGLFFSKAG